MNDYNRDWCDERHEKIDREFKNVWTKMRTMEGRLWAIILLLVFNLGVVIVTALVK